MLLKSCLSDINKVIPLWYFGILLTEKDERSLSSILNLKTDELTKQLDTCIFVTIKVNIIKCVVNKADYLCFN